MKTFLRSFGISVKGWATFFLGGGTLCHYMIALFVYPCQNPKYGCSS